MPDYSILLPAFNEAKRITRTLEHIAAFASEKAWHAEVLVIDDGSVDATAAVVEGIASRHPLVRLIRLPRNRGKGHAIRVGVMEAQGKFILFADADDSTPIADAEKLFGALAEGADIAIGSRWVDPSLQLQPQPLHRLLNGRFYNLLMRRVLGLRFKDTQNGFKAYRASAAKAIFPLQRIGGWGFDAEVLYLARKFRFTVSEIPVEYTYFAEGSKIRPYRDGARMVAELLRVKWLDWIGAYPGEPPLRTAFGNRERRDG